MLCCFCQVNQAIGGTSCDKCSEDSTFVFCKSCKLHSSYKSIVSMHRRKCGKLRFKVDTKVVINCKTSGKEKKWQKWRPAIIIKLWHIEDSKLYPYLVRRLSDNTTLYIPEDSIDLCVEMINDGMSTNIGILLQMIHCHESIKTLNEIITYYKLDINKISSHMLFTAAGVGRSDVILFLHDAKQDVEVIDDQGRNILHIAILKKQFELLYWANKVIFESSDLLHKLLKLIQGSDNRGFTILHYAVLSRNEDFVKWLTAGNDFALLNTWKYRKSMCISQSRYHADSVGGILLHDSSYISRTKFEVTQYTRLVNLKDSQGRTALNLAEAFKEMKVVSLLNEHTTHAFLTALLKEIYEKLCNSFPSNQQMDWIFDKKGKTTSRSFDISKYISDLQTNCQHINLLSFNFCQDTQIVLQILAFHATVHNNVDLLKWLVDVWGYDIQKPTLDFTGLKRPLSHCYIDKFRKFYPPKILYPLNNVFFKTIHRYVRDEKGFDATTSYSSQYKISSLLTIIQNNSTIMRDGYTSNDSQFVSRSCSETFLIYDYYDLFYNNLLLDKFEMLGYWNSYINRIIKPHIEVLNIEMLQYLYSFPNFELSLSYCVIWNEVAILKYLYEEKRANFSAPLSSDPKLYAVAKQYKWYKKNNNMSIAEFLCVYSILKCSPHIFEYLYFEIIADKYFQIEGMNVLHFIADTNCYLILLILVKTLCQNLSSNKNQNDLTTLDISKLFTIKTNDGLSICQLASTRCDDTFMDLLLPMYCELLPENFVTEISMVGDGSIYNNYKTSSNESFKIRSQCFEIFHSFNNMLEKCSQLVSTDYESYVKDMIDLFQGVSDGYVRFEEDCSFVIRQYKHNEKRDHHVDILIDEFPSSFSQTTRFLDDLFIAYYRSSINDIVNDLSTLLIKLLIKLNNIHLFKYLLTCRYTDKPPKAIKYCDKDVPKIRMESYCKDNIKDIQKVMTYLERYNNKDNIVFSEELLFQENKLNDVISPLHVDTANQDQRKEKAILLSKAIQSEEDIETIKTLYSSIIATGSYDITFEKIKINENDNVNFLKYAILQNNFKLIEWLIPFYPLGMLHKALVVACSSDLSVEAVELILLYIKSNCPTNINNISIMTKDRMKNELVITFDNLIIDIMIQCFYESTFNRDSSTGQSSYSGSLKIFKYLYNKASEWDINIFQTMTSSSHKKSLVLGLISSLIIRETKDKWDALFLLMQGNNNNKLILPPQHDIVKCIIVQSLSTIRIEFNFEIKDDDSNTAKNFIYIPEKYCWPKLLKLFFKYHLYLDINKLMGCRYKNEFGMFVDILQVLSEDYEINIQNPKIMFLTKNDPTISEFMTKLETLQHKQRERWKLIEGIEKGYTNAQLDIIMNKNIGNIACHKDGKFATHIAAYHNRPNVITWLVEKHKYNINAQDDEGNTPLTMALKCGSSATAEVIIKIIANKTIRQFCIKNYIRRKLFKKEKHIRTSAIHIQKYTRRWLVYKRYHEFLQARKGSWLQFKGLYKSLFQLIEKKAMWSSSCSLLPTWSELKLGYEMEAGDEDDDNDGTNTINNLIGNNLDMGHPVDCDEDINDDSNLDSITTESTNDDVMASQLKDIEINTNTNTNNYKLENIEFTSAAIKWLESTDTKYLNMFIQRVSRLANGDQSYALSKRLKHCKSPIYESKLDSGTRILWSRLQRTESKNKSILIWVICKHDFITREATRIDHSYTRLRSSLSAELEDTNYIILKDNDVLIEPASNVPLKMYIATKDELQLISSGDWKPPLLLNKYQKEINETVGTMLLLGRSGTGKTLSLCDRMRIDRHKNNLFSISQLFVSRSNRLCEMVKSVQKRECSADELSKTHFMTLDKFILKIEKLVKSSSSETSFIQYLNSKYVDYSIFRDKIFPVIKGKITLDSLVVWTQIRTHIKGSLEAVLQKEPISLVQYLDTDKFGKDRCKLSVDQRKDVYRIYINYQSELKANDMWDDTDRVLRILTESKLEPLGTCYNQDTDYTKVYVDEIQDCTQAEIILFFLAAGFNSKSLFLAGDPVQSVVPGVDFRFEEIRSIVYQLSNGQDTIEKPCKLFINYRSHEGILRMAAAVLDWLFKAFPAVAKILPKDSGLFKVSSYQCVYI